MGESRAALRCAALHMCRLGTRQCWRHQPACSPACVYRGGHQQHQDWMSVLHETWQPPSRHRTMTCTLTRAPAALRCAVQMARCMTR